jgi:hypothetical protein
MAILKGQMEIDNGDVLYPKTSSDNVIDASGKTVAVLIGDIDGVLSAVINGTDFDAQLTELLGV